MAPVTISSILNLALHHNDRRQTESSTSKPDNRPLSPGAKAGIALGVIVPAILISLAVFYLYTHKWKFPQTLRPSLPLSHWQRPKILSSQKWRSKPWQRVASVTVRTSPSTSQSNLEQPAKVDVETSERPVPGKWWSAEEIGTAGEKNNTGRSRFSVIAPAEPREPKVVKAPRPPSIFTSKTSIYGAERGKGEPEVVRPSSRHVKTWSRHISTQFMDLGRPATKRGDGVEESGDVKTERRVSVKPSKRDSKSVITDLNWMEYEPR